MQHKSTPAVCFCDFKIRFFVEMLSGQWLLTNSFIHVLSLPFLTCLISSSSDYMGSCVGDMTEDFPSSD